MNHSIISTRYAKALMMAGIENQCLDDLKSDMELLSATIAENQLFRQVLDNPVIKPQQKRRVIAELLEKRAHPLTINIINLIIRNRREFLLADVARNFIALYEKSKGIMQAQAISATDMDDSSKRSLQQQLNQLFDADVRINSETNPALLGGFILRVGGHQYDASLSSALKRMQKSLIV